MKLCCMYVVIDLMWCLVFDRVMGYIVDIAQVFLWDAYMLGEYHVGLTYNVIYMFMLSN